MSHRWYIVHAHSGFEKKVADAIKETAGKKDLDQFFGEIVVPTEQVVEVKKGKRVQSERKFFPGYVMVQMDLNDETWQLVKNTARVSGFLGGKGNKPQPLSDREAEQIFAQVEEGMTSPKNALIFNLGEQVKVVDGPFASFVGTIEEIDDEKNRLKVAVSIFGRSTPVDLDYDQVEKN